MKPIILFIPWYGGLPPYISAFFHTVEKQADFLDVFFVTSKDNISILNSASIPNNVIIHALEWSDLCSLITEEKDLPKPFSPYKLCDYKTAYGYIFEKYTRGYEYWGYCDVDILMGNVEAFLKENNFRQYDRIGGAGHFTIYRNTEEMRCFFKKECHDMPTLKTFLKVCKTTYPCHFDENISNKMFKHIYGEKRFLEKNWEFNTAIGCKGCHTYQYRDLPQLLTWEDGHTFSYVKKGTSVEKTESMYIHFMLQKNVKSDQSLSNYLLLSTDSIFSFDKNNLDDYFYSIGRVDTIIERKEAIDSFLKNIRKQRIQRFKNEVKTVGFFNALKNLISRSPALFQLIYHNTL